LQLSFIRQTISLAISCRSLPRHLAGEGRASQPDSSRQSTAFEALLALQIPLSPEMPHPGFERMDGL
jgi:hypothetical protein